MTNSTHPTPTIAARLPRGLRDALEADAARRGLSLSETIRFHLIRAVTPREPRIAAERAEP